MGQLCVGGNGGGRCPSPDAGAQCRPAWLTSRLGDRALRLAKAENGEAGGALLTGLLPTQLAPGTHAHMPDDALGTEQEQPPDLQPAPEPTGLTLKREPGLEATLLGRRILDLGTHRRRGLRVAREWNGLDKAFGMG